MTTPRDVTSGSRAHRAYSVVVFIVLASLDNVAIGLVPPLYRPIAADLGVSEKVVGAVTALSYLVTAIAAVCWAYLGDRTRRKPLLMVGTVIWSVGIAATATVEDYAGFLAAQLLASVGLGAVASVGFSVVSDLISPRRRGLVMSFWGLSQGVGTLVGTLLAGALGATHWREPFGLLAIVGVVATVAYLFTYDTRRGQSEPALAAVFAAGEDYDYRITRADVPAILGRRTNRWLILQGLTAQVVFGSLAWLPQLFQARALDLGYAEPTAIRIGAIFATIFQLGGALSILGGLVGDRLQRRTPRGRALVAAVGILAGIPFYVVLFFLPLRLSVTADASTGEILGYALGSLFTDPTMALAFLAAVTALALTSANSPNWFSLIADVNPPEHRGTVYSLGNLVNGVGRAIGNSMYGVVLGAFGGPSGGAHAYATGLAVFQAFFVPTGVMYYLASRTAPGDIAAVDATLRARARSTLESQVAQRNGDVALADRPVDGS
ncbi:MFS transporter [Luedemannella flava]|uniref:MFS transporter n=1 Tax=Luedemannella flava TaxID=349316 RepID=UPI0031D3A58E